MKSKLIASYGLVNRHSADDEGTSSETEGRDSEKDLVRVAFFNLSMTVKDGKPTKVPGCEHLFVGSIGSAYNIDGLKSSGITHILCLSDVIMTKYEDQFEYLRVSMVDKLDYNIAEALPLCFDFINSTRHFITSDGQPGRVLVHCYQGKSRSVAVCCGYLIQYLNYSYDDALQAIRSVRPVASPNSSFDKALRLLEVNCGLAQSTCSSSSEREERVVSGSSSSEESV